MHQNAQIENKIRGRNCVFGKRKTEKIMNLNGTDPESLFFSTNRSSIEGPFIIKSSYEAEEASVWSVKGHVISEDILLLRQLHFRPISGNCECDLCWPNKH
jgi:hypothetical protein